MIIHSVLSRTPTYWSATANTGSSPTSGTAPRQTTINVVGEYFVSASGHGAKSDVDYLVSPIEQIRTQLNKWFKERGHQTRVQRDDAGWLVAPSAQIPAGYFDSYEPFFRAVLLYQARIEGWNGEDSRPPSEEQMNAAFLGLANLMAALVPAPSPMLLENGTIGGYWRRGRCYASIDFEVDGEHTWAGTDGEEFHSGTWRVPGNPLPPALTSDLHAIGY